MAKVCKRRKFFLIINFGSSRPARFAIFLRVTSMAAIYDITCSVQQARFDDACAMLTSRVFLPRLFLPFDGSDKTAKRRIAPPPLEDVCV
jgi:hypothetical protein